MDSSIAKRFYAFSIVATVAAALEIFFVTIYGQRMAGSAISAVGLVACFAIFFSSYLSKKAGEWFSPAFIVGLLGLASCFSGLWSILPFAVALIWAGFMSTDEDSLCEDRFWPVFSIYGTTLVLLWVAGVVLWRFPSDVGKDIATTILALAVVVPWVGLWLSRGKVSFQREVPEDRF